MTALVRARVVKAAAAVPTATPETARRVPAAVAAASEEAERILAAARADAARVGAEAAAHAASEARAAETAKLAAAWLALRAREEEAAARHHQRVVDAATALAERLLGESLRLEPTRIAELAVTALAEARAVRATRIEASPDDAAALREALATLGQAVEVTTDATLGRGSLVVHTDLGTIDARLEPQLERLAGALAEALR